MNTLASSGSRSRFAKRSVGARHPLAYAIASVLALAAFPSHASNTAPALSQAWLQQQNQAATQGGGNAGSAATSGIAALTPAQLLQQQTVQQSLSDLNRAAQMVAAQMSAQQSAQQAAQQQVSPVPNGLAAGGLVVASGIASNPSLWQNANLPTQSTSNGQVTVQVQQTAPKAILTWNSFNVGRNTTLYFNQSGGNQTNGDPNNWIVLNRVNDPSGVPSQIFGQIKAEGTVYLLNHNGILFGAGSQVNTGSLLASSLDLFSGNVATSNSDFLTGGIASGNNPSGAFLVDGNFTDGLNHDVVVQQGASITSGQQGYVLLAAPNVSNAGSIVADNGQAFLAAGVQFDDVDAGDQNDPLSLYDALATGAISGQPVTQGTATNTGLVQARRGQVHMLGYNVDQDGVALASTSINYPGSIELNAQDQGADDFGDLTYGRGGALVLGPKSVTAVLPEEDGTTTNSSTQATETFVPSKLNLSGQTVTFQSGSLLDAPAAALTVQAELYTGNSANANPVAGRIYVDNGSVIDVSGLANVELPISALLVTIPRIGQNELADSPLLRDSFLYTQQNVVIDSTQSGTLPDGLSWIGSPILDVSGYVQDIPRDVSQLMTNGGTINLNGYEVIVRSGAQLNLNGGYIAYQPGWITTPNLLGSDGRIYNIADADPDMTYVGFAGQYTVDDARWGVTTNYSSPLLAGATRWDDGFAVGGNAGTLSIETLSALALDGEITAQAFPGRNQVAQGAQPTGGTLDVNVSPETNTALLRRNDVTPGVLLQQSSLTVDQLDAQFQANTPWQTVLTAEDPNGTNPYDLVQWLPVSANLVQQGGFSALNINAGSSIQEQAGTVLSVVPGGSIQLTANNNITLLGELSAPAGTITATLSGVVPVDQSSITVGSDATLSTAGLWVNDSGADADNYIGDRYINGGSIDLVTNQDVQLAKSGPNVDDTGSIVLQTGSLLDVSSGGYVNQSGQLQLANGVPIGNAGNIELATYVAGKGASVFDGSVSLAPPGALDASVVMDGTLRAFGFSAGGTFTLQAADLQIGGGSSSLAMSNGVYLSPSFFAGQGFDSYNLTSMTDAKVAPGATVQVTRDNLLPTNYAALLTAPTGTNIYGASPVNGAAYTSIGQLAPYLRYITLGSAGSGLSLSAGTYLTWPSAPQDRALGAPAYAGVTGSVVLGEGSSILTDAGATVQLQGNQSVVIDGTVQAPGGNIDITTNPSNLALTYPNGTSATQLWLGSQAVLDTNGVSLINPLAGAVTGGSVALGVASRYTPRTGEVLNGGDVNLISVGGYLVTQQGSVIEASGTSDTYDLPVESAAGNAAYVATPVWSNGGNILFAAAAGMYADGTLLAAGGNPSAEGGSLQIEGLSSLNNIVSRPSATAIILQQSGYLLPQGLQPGDAVEPSGPSGILHFALDRLNGSGITSLAIGPNPAGSQQSGAAVALPVGFAGNVDIALGRSFTLYATNLTALPVGSESLAPAAIGHYEQGNGSVSISAPYVELLGGNSNVPQALAGDGTLSINAGFMDIGGQLNLQGWSQTNLVSSGDMRFYVPANQQFNPTTGASNTGLLFTTGNLTLQAAQLYPISDYNFVVDANPSGLSDAQGKLLTTTLTILGNGASSAPLSAGGSLLLDADNIVQDGTVRVPSGNLVIGVQDPSTVASSFDLGATPSNFPLVATQNVTLGNGSITSVSLNGLTVPYGTTTDGLEWSYNGDPSAPTAALSAPPSKSISIGGTNVSLDSGATIDVSGGGNLQASEWVPGVGGSRDVLSQYETSYANSTTGTQVPQYSDGRAIYAIVPGYSAPVAAQDAALEEGAGAGPATGQSVYLSGMPGLPAGYYTLLPAKYATLPGAYRVVQDTSSQDSVLGQNGTQPDGTMVVTGYFADALDGARAARTTTFLVQSSSVWQQYSQYTLTNANTYFASQAANAGTVTPELPQDAGHLELSATNQLQLGATLLGTPASGGRSSLVDIAAQAIQVVSPDSTPISGYLQVSADGLSALDAGSLLLGGTRQLGSDGYQIDSIADSVVLSNDAAHPLQGPEILLVANGNNDSGAQGIVLQQGSVLTASGASSANGVPLIFGSDASTSSSGASIAAVSGNGALLRVSQDGAVDITRNDTSGTTFGDLTIDAGATVQGGSSLALDATGVTTVSPTAVFNAQNIQADANLITFVDSDTSSAGIGGLVIGPGTLNLLSGAQQVTLDSRGAIDFVGNLAIDLPQSLNLNANAFVSDGGQVSIKATTLGLGNALGGSAATASGGAGQLVLNANELDFTAGASSVQGFGTITGTATSGIAGEGSGSFDFGNANVTLNTPVLLAQTGANTSLTTTGALAINAVAGTPLQNSDALGGVFNLTGGSLTVGTQIMASAGNVKLEATSGDLTLASGADVDAAGINKTFFDATTYAPAGEIALLSDNGSVIVQSGATVDFAGGPQGGTAGDVTIEAASQATLAGTFEGQGYGGYRGGYFTLSSGGAQDLDQLAQLTANAGTTGGISITTGAGNLLLSSGQSLVAQDVYLSANGGAGAVNSAAGVVQIDGTINASGNAAGAIDLYGRNGVNVNGSLLAVSSVPEQRGGIVSIGTSGTPNGSLDPTYGYEEVDSGSAGAIQFGPNAVINVSGGTPDVNGYVTLRAPLLDNGDVPIYFSGSAPVITGASNVSIEPYAVWSTTDNQSNPAKYFDGIIDPAGWYQPAAGGVPQLVAGTWTDATGATLPAPTSAAMLQAYLSADYFTPSSPDTAHETFYGYVNGDPNQGAGTLMSYVEQPGYTFGNRFTNIANAQVQPGIELINPSTTVNNGNISVLTNWNLGAGVTDTNGNIQLAYRYQPTAASASGSAPILTVLALHDLDIDASITDGFYQQNTGAEITNPVAPVGSNQAYAAALQAYQSSVTYLETQAFFSGDYLWQPNPSLNGSSTFVFYNGGVDVILTNSQSVASANAGSDYIYDQYYDPITAPLPSQSAAYYKNYMAYITEVGAGGTGSWSLAYNYGDNNTFLSYNPTALAAPQPASFSTYAAYVTAYQTWLTSNFGSASASGDTNDTPSPLLLPLATEAASNYTNYSTDYSTYMSGYVNYFTYVSTQIGDVYTGSSQLFYAPNAPAQSNAPGQIVYFTANNSPSNMPSLNNPASLASATLLGGSSSTYRLVAGANFNGVDPLSVVSSTDAGNIDLDGNFSAQYTAPGGDGKTLEFPTTVRTGIGSIYIASAGDIDWLDTTAPATIYTAGEPASGTTAGTSVSVFSTANTAAPNTPDFLVTGLVNPVNAGNIVLSAQGNINGIEQVYDTSGAQTGVAGSYIGQFWWPWMQTGNSASQSSINFANFDQGVMSVGGNVAVNAGGNINELSVSLPTTWYANAGGASITTVGGGDLAVSAGGDILSGSYFVAKGQGSLSAGGLIGSDFSYTTPSQFNSIGGVVTPVATVLGLQDGQWMVQAKDGVNLGGAYDPSYGVAGTGAQIIPTGSFDSQPYSTTSALNVTSTSGDVSFDSLSVPAAVFGYGSSPNVMNPGAVLPASMSLEALSGNVNILGSGGLYPSATGNLTILAADSVNMAQLVYTLGSDYSRATSQSLGLIDAASSVLPSPLDPNGIGIPSAFVSNELIGGYLDNGPDNSLSAELHQQTSLHGSDTTPVEVIALNGSINDGAPIQGVFLNPLILAPDKPAVVEAGQDIVDLSFLGQQTHASDTTLISAGRNLYDTTFYTGSILNGNDFELVPSILLGGVGNLIIEAGHNIGPLTSQTDLSPNSSERTTGIETVGNQVNPYLPHDGANIDVLFGVGPGVETSNFLAQYLNGATGFGTLVPDLVSFMEQQQEGQVVDTGFAQDQINVVLTPQQAEAAFQKLPSYEQQMFAQQEFFKLLAQVGADYNDPTSPYYHKYARGYAAIESLFPASLGYTDNGAGNGGINGAAQTIDTGDLDIRSSTIQTQQGGNISILGPGGQALVGSTEAPPVIVNNQGTVVAGPNSMGILTLEQGNVDIFTDRSLLLAQSRIFTEQGGNMVIWSSNGDINAGQGAKTTEVIPPPTYLCDPDAYCLVDARGEVSGAGIATLQTVPDAPPGDVYLIAPRGTVDAGDAGIRVSGNLVVAAAAVANATNIQVQGQKIGVPVTQSVNFGALNAANAASGAVSKVAQDMLNQQQSDANSRMPSIISVQVLGFGDSGASILGSGSGYDPNSPVQILGAGRLSDARKLSLTDAERQRLAE